jgi:type IVB pilus formation R64 PilN family outer membrane protein
VNPALGSVSVTGTPNQVRRVEEWAKTLADSMSQMVAITIHMYSVKITAQDNYGWTPDVIFKGLKTQYGFNLAGQPNVPVINGSSALNFTASVLSSATGSKAQYSGSQLALQALSQLGDVDEILSRTVVTLNGEPIPVQVANQKGYVSSQTAPTSVPTGTVPPAPTLTTSTITTGFTAQFLPRVANGKIWMTMGITDSKLLSLDKAGGDASQLIQNPNVDLQRMDNSVRLTPGDTVLLTGHRQESASSSTNGTGAPNNYLLGGGVGRNASRQMIAIVVSAKVL